MVLTGCFVEAENMVVLAALGEKHVDELVDTDADGEADVREAHRIEIPEVQEERSS